MELYLYPLVLLLFVLLFAREVIAPASQNSCDRRWLVLSSALGAAAFVGAVGLGYLFSDVIRARALLPAPSSWPAPVVGLISFLTTSFIFYWWHRATHASDFLWRHVHQLHHSAQRIEALTAFYAHPLDAAFATVIGCFSSYIVFGASPVAAGWALLFTAAFDLFVHWDIRSPRWIGWVMHRPEMHRVHHRHGHHAQNYGLPIWDQLFGTWHNPVDPVVRVGFDDDKSARVTAMLRGVDVHR